MEDKKQKAIQTKLPQTQSLVNDQLSDSDIDKVSEENEENADPVEFIDQSLDENSTVEVLPADQLSDWGEDSTADHKMSSSTAVVRYDPLGSYLAEIRNLPTLTREEEHKLAVRYREHADKMAGYKLVLANLKLVVMVAREYQKNVQNILDLVQEGNIGLLEAVEQYDPYRGIRFPSYAVYWIRAYMLRYLINNLRLVKIGTTQAQRKLFFNLQKEKARLEADGFAPEAKLLADRLNVKESEVMEMEQRLALPDVSVDSPLRNIEGAADLHGVLPDKSETAEDVVIREQFSQALHDALDKFKDRADEKEKAIIEQRLFTEDPVTLQVIADQFGVTRERIRQIESRLKEKLKNYLAQNLQLDSGGEIELDLE